MVPETSLERAAALLSQDYSYNVDMELGSHKEHCPKCGSTQIKPITKGKRVAYLMFILFQFPLYRHDHGLKCNACGHFWHPSGK